MAKKFGLIGKPIDHSLSPMLFEVAYHGKYDYDLIEASSFLEAMEIVNRDYDAVNVTAPYKVLAFNAADDYEFTCDSTGAANVLFKDRDCDYENGKDFGLVAYNSDIMGAKECIDEGLEKVGHDDEESVQGMTALIVGAGGAAAAAAVASVIDGLDIIILDRNLTKAENLCKKVRKTAALMVENQDFDYRPKVRKAEMKDFDDEFAKADVVVWAVPVPFSKSPIFNGNDFKWGKEVVLSEKKVIVEANYRDPAFNEDVLNRLKEVWPNLAYLGGKRWLVYQAIEGFKEMTGEEPDIEALVNVF